MLAVLPIAYLGITACLVRREARLQHQIESEDYVEWLAKKFIGVIDE